MSINKLEGSALLQWCFHRSHSAAKKETIADILNKMIAICDRSLARSEQFHRYLAHLKEQIAAREKNSSVEADQSVENACPIISSTMSPTAEIEDEPDDQAKPDLESLDVVAHEDDEHAILVALVTVEKDKPYGKRVDSSRDNESHIPIALAVEGFMANTPNLTQELVKKEGVAPSDSHFSFDDSIINRAPTIDSTCPLTEIRVFPTPPPKPPYRSSYAVLVHSSFNLSTQLLLPWMPMVFPNYVTMLLVPNITSVPLASILTLPQPLPPKPPYQSHCNKHIHNYVRQPGDAYFLSGTWFSWVVITWSIKFDKCSKVGNAWFLFGVLFPYDDSYALVVFDKMTRRSCICFTFVSFLGGFSCHNVMYESGFGNTIKCIWPLDSALLHGVRANSWYLFPDQNHLNSFKWVQTGSILHLGFPSISYTQVVFEEMQERVSNCCIITNNLVVVSYNNLLQLSQVQSLQHVQTPVTLIENLNSMIGRRACDHNMNKLRLSYVY